jgi:CO/xanthine dehydrogenase Mo-binding subunit
MDTAFYDPLEERDGCARSYSHVSDESASAEPPDQANVKAEIVVSGGPLPRERKWEIRLSRNRDATIVIGMRDGGDVRVSRYFAEIVASRLGVPLHRIRLFYICSHPAALRTPLGACAGFHHQKVSAAVAAAARVINDLCGSIDGRTS